MQTMTSTKRNVQEAGEASGTATTHGGGTAVHPPTPNSHFSFAAFRLPARFFGFGCCFVFKRVCI